MTSKLLVSFYSLMALFFATLGLGLLIAPQALPGPLHVPATTTDIWLHQAGIGMLLAAALNLLCLAGNARPALHWLLLSFAVATAATYGVPTLDTAWLWLPAALYLLVLLPSLLRRLPKPGLGRGKGNELDGEIKWFNPNKGFGFIIMPDKREYFVHFSTLQNGDRNSLKPGTRVRFQLRETRRGDQACDVYIR